MGGKEQMHSVQVVQYQFYEKISMLTEHVPVVKRLLASSGEQEELQQEEQRAAQDEFNVQQQVCFREFGRAREAGGLFR